MATKIEDPNEYFTQLREKYKLQQKEAQTSLDEAEGWLRGLDALERERHGRPAHTPSEAKPKGTRAPQEGSRKQEVLNLINANPDGLQSRQVIDMLGARDNKTKTTGINNALNALKKSGQIEQPGGRGGMYMPAAKRPREEQSAPALAEAEAE